MIQRSDAFPVIYVILGDVLTGVLTCAVAVRFSMPIYLSKISHGGRGGIRTHGLHKADLVSDVMVAMRRNQDRLRPVSVQSGHFVRS